MPIAVEVFIQNDPGLADTHHPVRDTRHLATCAAGVVIELTRLSGSKARGTYGMRKEEATNKLRLVPPEPLGNSMMEENNHEDR